MIAAMAAALCIALPQMAVAQSVGDEQYRDPFGGQDPQEEQQREQPQAPTDSAGTQAAPAQATPPQAPAASAQAGGELPRTGFQGVVLIIAYGWALLVGGVALRRVA